MAKSKGQSPLARKPSLVLLALVDQFLVDNGFHSSSRIFHTARKKRPKSEGWVGLAGKDYTANVPTLETIFKQWEEEHLVANQSRKEISASHTQDTSPDDDSNDSTTSDSDSDSDDGTNLKQTKKKEEPELQESASSTASSESDSGSASDSDTDSDSDSGSEADDVVVEDRITTTVADSKTNPLKRKIADATPSESSSFSEDDSGEDQSSSSEDEGPATKKTKVESTTSESDSEPDSDADRLELAANVRLPSSDSSEGSTSSDDSDSTDDSSDSDESDRDTAALKRKGASATEERLSESSGTVTGDLVMSASVSRSRSNNLAASETTQVEEVVIKKKHVGARPTRLAELSATANLDDYVSNDYISYDYADKAYRDLVVTRGKGFTKEKNKKKRGSYRGGTIDTSGGKGFKFDD